MLVDEVGEHDAREGAGGGEEGTDVAADDGGVDGGLVRAHIGIEDAHRDVVDEVAYEEGGEPIGPDGVGVAKPFPEFVRDALTIKGDDHDEHGEEEGDERIGELLDRFLDIDDAAMPPQGHEARDGKKRDRADEGDDPHRQVQIV